MSGRRTKIEIIYDILKAIQDKQGIIKPTHLLYKSNLSHQKMKLYLKELIEKELITVKHDKKGKYYMISDNGLKFLVEYKKIREFTDSFGL